MTMSWVEAMASPTWTCREDQLFSKLKGQPWCGEHDKPLSTVTVDGEGRICNTGVEALPHEFSAMLSRRFARKEIAV